MAGHCEGLVCLGDPALMLKFSDGSILGLVVVFQIDPCYKPAERFALYKTDRMPVQYI